MHSLSHNLDYHPSQGHMTVQPTGAQIQQPGIGSQGVRNSQAVGNAGGQQVAVVDCKNPFSIKLEFIIKSVHVTCRSNVILFGVGRKILFMDYKDILKQKEKIKENKRVHTLQNISYPDYHQIEPHPSVENVVASVSNQTALIWDINKPDTEIRKLYNMQAMTSIGWKQDPNEDQDVMAITAHDKILLWDIRQQNYTHRQDTSQVYKVQWNKCNLQQYVSGHDNLIKVWDQRNPTIPLYQFEAYNQRVRNLDIDPTYGKLLLTSSQDILKLFRLGEDRAEHILNLPLENAIGQASFLPFGQGMTVLANGMKYYQFQDIENQLGIIDRSDVLHDATKLQQQQSDPKYFAFRTQEDEHAHHQQVITITSDSKLNIQQLEPDFVETFSRVKLKSLFANNFGAGNGNGYGMNFGSDGELRQKPNAAFDSNNINSYLNKGPEKLTQAQIIINEIDKIKTFLKILLIGKPEYGHDEEGEQIINTLSLKIILDNQILIFLIQFPSNYPNEPPVFEIGSRMNVSVSEVKLIVDSLNNTAFEIASQENPQPSLVRCMEQLKFHFSGGINSGISKSQQNLAPPHNRMTVNLANNSNNINNGNSGGGGSNGAAGGGSSEPVTFDNNYGVNKSNSAYNLASGKGGNMLDAIIDEGGPASNQYGGENEEEKGGNQKEKHFIPYVKTNGFAWSQQGQLVFFSYSKYNFAQMNEKPQRKKLYSLNEIKNLQIQISKRNNRMGRNQALLDYDEDNQSHQDSSSDGTSTQLIQNQDDDEEDDEESDGDIAGDISNEDEDYGDSENDEDDEDEDLGDANLYNSRQRRNNGLSQNRNHSSNNRLKQNEEKGGPRNERNSRRSINASIKGQSKNDQQRKIRKGDRSNYQSSTRLKINLQGANGKTGSGNVALGALSGGIGAGLGFVAGEDKNKDTFFLKKHSMIFVYDVQYLFNVSKALAKDWEIFSNDIKKLCNQNSHRCLEMEKFELAEAWNMISICLGGINQDFAKFAQWNHHPLGKGLAYKLLKTFEQQADIQSLALLSALIFGCETKVYTNLQEIQQQQIVKKPTNKQYNRQSMNLGYKQGSNNYRNEPLQLAATGGQKSGAQTPGGNLTQKLLSKISTPKNKKKRHNDGGIKKSRKQNFVGSYKSNNSVYLDNNSNEDCDWLVSQNNYNNHTHQYRKKQKGGAVAALKDQMQVSNSYRNQPSIIYGDQDDYYNHITPQKKSMSVKKSFEEETTDYVTTNMNTVANQVMFKSRKNYRKPSTPEDPRGYFSLNLFEKENIEKMIEDHDTAAAAAGYMQNEENTGGQQYQINGDNGQVIQQQYMYDNYHNYTNLARGKQRADQTPQYQNDDYMRKDQRQGNGVMTIDTVATGLSKFQKSQFQNYQQQLAARNYQIDNKNQYYDGLGYYDDDERSYVDGVAGAYAVVNQNEIVEREREDINHSLIIKDNPQLCQSMMLYMKQYVELLMGWKMNTQSIQMCKIIAQADDVLGQYAKLMTDQGKLKQSIVKLAKSNYTIKDYLPYSNLSIGNVCETLSNQESHDKLITGNLPTCNDCCKVVQQQCSICNLSVKGLLFVCRVCGHGGHYEHVKQWFDFKAQSMKKEDIPCPTGCGCTSCYMVMG